MNLSSRVSKLESSASDTAPLVIWADHMTPKQVAAEIAQRIGSDPRRRVLLVGWKQLPPEQLAALPQGSVSIATGVPRSAGFGC